MIRAFGAERASSVKAFTSEAKLSPEEDEAIETLRKEAGPTVEG